MKSNCRRLCLTSASVRRTSPASRPTSVARNHDKRHTAVRKKRSGGAVKLRVDPKGARTGHGSRTDFDSVPDSDSMQTEAKHTEEHGVSNTQEAQKLRRKWAFRQAVELLSPGFAVPGKSVCVIAVQLILHVSLSYCTKKVNWMKSL